MVEMTVAVVMALSVETAGPEELQQHTRFAFTATLSVFKSMKGKFLYSTVL